MVQAELLTDWLVENHKKLNLSLSLVGDKTPEGHQFIKSFGIAGFLRFEIDVSHLMMGATGEDDIDIDEDFI